MNDLTIPASSIPTSLLSLTTTISLLTKMSELSRITFWTSLPQKPITVLNLMYGILWEASVK